MDQASVPRSRCDKCAQLEEALASRDLIATAKGLLMERESCTVDEAFDMLPAASQTMNIKLRDIARHVVADAERRAECSRKVEEAEAPTGPRVIVLSDAQKRGLAGARSS